MAVGQKTTLQADEKTDAPRSGRRGGYSSPSIIERRHRILAAARQLIAEKDIHDISMDEVAEQAQVAKRTLYNIFRNRDLLIAAAIYKYFEDFEKKIRYRTEPASPARMIEHLDVVIRRNLEVRSYTRALLAAFFSPDADDDVRRTIFEIAAHSHRPWVERLYRDGQLQPWVDPQILIEDLVRYRYALGLDWALGRVEGADFGPIIIKGVLTMVAGACRQNARDEIDAALITWAELAPGQ
ncbi:MAG: TetR/AcrR family transcriptional regulator [Sphingobium sp.]|nr:TetR/AcrR family transcriptional regulator [Sphingobium sp.]MCP5398191.1 TetR/AcrR family transcriptional regulator [Sphingomonas sp.]